jgi:hypothetical protein
MNIKKIRFNEIETKISVTLIIHCYGLRNPMISSVIYKWSSTRGTLTPGGTRRHLISIKTKPLETLTSVDPRTHEDSSPN